MILLPGLSAFFNSWSLIYVGITFPTVLLILLLYWTPDSPRWLLRRAADRFAIDQVEEIVREGAAINDRTFKIPPDFRQQLEQLSEQLKAQPAPAPWRQLWVGKRAKTHMVAAHLALAFFVINFMGMLLNIRSFGRDYLVPNTIAMGKMARNDMHKIFRIENNLNSLLFRICRNHWLLFGSSLHFEAQQVEVAMCWGLQYISWNAGLPWLDLD